MYRPAHRRNAKFMIAVALIAIALPSARAAAQEGASGPNGYTAADVTFMQGMIIHHAQAVVMSDWAPTHGAEPSLLILCKRIALSQRDEINLMQRWLEERHLPAPDPLHMLQKNAGPVVDRSSMHMPGMDMGDRPMMMSGMLSPEEMRQLDASHSKTFDRLYLTGMLKHHQGALDMVATLDATPGAGQQSEISGYATDIDASQRAQMTRMEALLKNLNPSGTK